MRLNGAIPVIAAMAVFAASSELYWEFIFWTGFPDGSATELEAAEAQLASGFIGFSKVIGVWLIFLAFLSRRRPIGRLFAFTCSAQVAVVVVCLAVDQYFRAVVNGGAGG
jgi:hypothetical protein